MTNFNFLTKFEDWLGELSSRMSLVGVSYEVGGARVAQEWLKYATTLLLLLSFGVGEIWSTNYSFTFASGDLTTTSTSFTKSSVEWSLSTTEDQWSGTANQNGYRFGSANSTKTLTISTSGISGTITAISVTGRSNNAKKTATVAVSVGDNSFSTTDDTWDNGNNQTLNFTGSSTGTISVTITPDGCGFILFGISVTYSTCTKLGQINGSVNLSHFLHFLHLVIISVFQRSIHILLSVCENTISRYTLVYTYSMYCGSNGGCGLSLSLTAPTAEHAVYTTHGGRAIMLLYASVFLPDGLHACLQPSAVPSLRGYVG